MRLTAVDIQTREFRRKARGYSTAEVDAFMQEVGDNFEELQVEAAQLREEVTRLRQAVERYESLEKSVNETLLLAQRTSDDVVANAHKEADLIVRGAEAEAREIPARARAERANLEREIAALTELRNEFEADFSSLLSSFTQRLTGFVRVQQPPSPPSPPEPTHVAPTPPEAVGPAWEGRAEPASTAPPTPQTPIEPVSEAPTPAGAGDVPSWLRGPNAADQGSPTP